MDSHDTAFSLFDRHLGYNESQPAGKIIIKKDIFAEFLRDVPIHTKEALLRIIPLTPPELYSMNFHTWVRDSREILKMTQTELSIETGIAQTALSTFETGQHKSFGRKRREKLALKITELAKKKTDV
jgi:hypothetical protein